MQPKSAACPAREQPPRIHRGHEEITPKVVSIKVSIKVISYGSISSCPLGRSRFAVLHSSILLRSEQARKKRDEQ